MLVESLKSFLENNAGLQSQLKTASQRSDSTNGIFPSIAPKEVSMPYLVYQQISGEPMTISMDGTNRLHTGRWRFSCYGTTYKQAKELAKFLKLAMISFNGVQVAGSTDIHGSWMKLELDDAESIPHGTIHATHLDFEINFLDYDES